MTEIGMIEEAEASSPDCPLTPGEVASMGWLPATWQRGLGSHESQLPMHGSNRELGTGLVNKIKKDLGLE